MYIEFGKKLLELGLSYSVNNDGTYDISSQNGGGNHIKVQLIPSEPSLQQVHGSKNGIDVVVIGLFNFKFLTLGFEPDILAFTFQNILKNQIEFLIIPTHEFERRHVKMHSGSFRRKSVKMVCWLMQDGFVFDGTNISVEGEWYFLSNGINGRLADGTDLDYSEYLNSWRRLIV